MKSFTLICFLVVILAAVFQANAQFGSDSSECGMCSRQCYNQGLMGDCDEYAQCRCTSCIYRACKRFCRSQGKLAQCDEDRCDCLV